MIERSDQAGVAILRMAGGKANTMSVEFCETLIANFEQALDARAVVITGSARIFSAGVDLVRLLDGAAPYIREFLPVLSTMFAAVGPRVPRGRADVVAPARLQDRARCRATPPPGPARGRR